MLSMTAVKEKEIRLINKGINTRKKIAFFTVTAAVYILAIMAAGLIMPPELYDVYYENKFISPCFAHLFGTDFMGRDMFWRSIKGLSNSIFVGMAASAVSSVIALVFGAAAAVCGGRVDRIINWLVDCFMGMPHLVLLLLISWKVILQD